MSTIATQPIGLWPRIGGSVCLNERITEIFRMTTRSVPVLSLGAQFLEGVGTRRVQQTIVIVSELKVGDDERLDDQAFDVVGDQGGIDISDHRGGGLQRKISM